MADRIAVAWVDVFADRPLTGNALTVVPDADRLDDATMRAVARELNQSETTFLLPADAAGATWRLRSFTAAGHEVGGAGHNALGAWLWLAGTGRVAAGLHHQQIGEAVLRVEVTGAPGTSPTVTMWQDTPTFGAAVHDPALLADLAAGLGLVASDLVPDRPVQVVSTGVGHLMVPLLDRATVDRARPDADRLRGVLAAAGGEGCYVYTTEAGDDRASAYTRFFNPTVGIVEDPGTGTAAGPLAAALVEHGDAQPGDPVWIEQGHAGGRPSRIRLDVDGDGVRISAGGVLVGEGWLRV